MAKPKKKKLLITLFKVLVLKSEECIKQTLLQSLFLIKPITCTLPANQVWFSIFHLLILLFWFLSKCMSVCNIKFHNLNLFTSLKKKTFIFRIKITLLVSVLLLVLYHDNKFSFVFKFRVVNMVTLIKPLQMLNIVLMITIMILSKEMLAGILQL